MAENVNSIALLDACFGMDDIAANVSTLPREQLEHLAGSSLALARLSTSTEFGVYARRMIANAVSRLNSACKPLDEHLLKLVRGSL